MKNVYGRIALYVLSPLLTALVAMIPGWGIGFSDGVLTIDIGTVAGAAASGLGLSAMVFAKWGVK